MNEWTGTAMPAAPVVKGEGLGEKINPCAGMILNEQ